MSSVIIAGDTSGTITLQAPAASGSSVLTLPVATDTLVGKATTDTLTNKTLTGAVMNGTVGATTPAAGAFTSLTASTTLGVTGVSTLTAGAIVQGLTVGLGAGAVSTNTAVGVSVLASANTGNGRNTGVGSAALTSNTSGENNSGFGQQALTLNTTGSSNVAVGYASLFLNTTGGTNTAVGQGSLQNNTTASNNTAVGYKAGYTNQTGLSNVFVGESAGYFSTVDGNTFIGQDAGYYVTTGSKNTILGGYNGNQNSLDIRTASNYIVLSDGDGNPRGVFDSSGNLGIGNTTPSTTPASGFVFQPAWTAANNGAFAVGHASGSASGSRYGVFAYNSTEIGSITQSGTTAVAYNTSSDYRLKENVQPMTGALATVTALKPVTFNWKSDGSDGQGFIAHELAEVVPDCVTGEKDAVDEEGNAKYQGVDTSFLVATLTAAIQELKAEFDAYKSTHP